MNQNDYKCKINKPHISRAIFILPCQNLACQECINKLTDHFKALTCPYCKKRHKSSELKLSPSVSYKVKDVTYELLNKLKKSSFDLKG